MPFENTVLILFGVYCIGGGLAMLVNPPRMQTLINNFSATPALSYLTGAILAPLGAGLILAVHDFTSLKRGLVSLLGAAMLIEGYLMMIAPRTLLSIATPFMSDVGVMRVYGVVTLAIGMVLLGLGHS